MPDAVTESIQLVVAEDGGIPAAQLADLGVPPGSRLWVTTVDPAPGASSGDGAAPGDVQARTDERDGFDAPISTLRGPEVRADVRRTTRIVVGLCLVVLTALVIALFLAGANKNAATSRLKHNGVPVTVTVTHCLGNASGSGAVLTGYTCHGTYLLKGYRYNEVIGGSNQPHLRGDVIQGVVDPDHPTEVTSAHEVATTDPSWRVYIAPIILMIVLILAVAVLVWRVRRRRGPNDRREPPDRESRLDGPGPHYDHPRRRDAPGVVVQKGMSA